MSVSQQLPDQELQCVCYGGKVFRVDNQYCTALHRKIPKAKVVSKECREGKDSVKVSCRVKPLMNNDETACLKVLSRTTVQMISPEVLNNRGCIYKEIQFTFNEVFSDTDSQKKVFDSVALPLVENLIQGKNSLLFTYGVTGSGKTYTMTGELEDGGILPRCIDVIFNSIAGFQSKKYVFKPDKMNGFDVQCESEAKLERVKSLKSLYTPKTPCKTPKKKVASTNINRVADNAKVLHINEDATYAVFVTYIEIYNNYVYDLLEHIPDERVNKGLQNKLIRSDSKNNMYVHSITELEVTTPQEAFEAFYNGQKRKKMANTNLNSESSRSHLIFTIRLVQAPLSTKGESAACDKKDLTVSQLSLVDLAGSERTSRTQNTGQRLREAGNINNSLMTLRTCLEILRENQLCGTNKLVPYRDSRITHLFKNFFEGEGQVRVIVCVNPRTDDYDETIHVMKFAEMTQDVHTVKPPIVEKPIMELLPYRRKAKQIFKGANRKLEAKGIGDGSGETDIGLVYSLGPPFPVLEMTAEDSERVIQDLMYYLEARMQRRVELTREVKKRQESFRTRLAEIQNEQILSRVQSSSLKSTLENERKRTTKLENQAIGLQNLVSELKRDIEDRENNIKTLSQDVRQLRLEINQKEFDGEKLKLKCSNTVVAEKEKWARECQQRLKEKEDELQSEVYKRDEKLRKMQEVLNERYPPGTSIQSSVAVVYPTQPSVYDCCAPASNGVCELHLPSVGLLNSVGKYSQTANQPGNVTTTPYQCRRSSCNDMWLNHRSAMPMQLGTVFQPKMKKRKSVTKLTDVADVADPKVSKYCLMTQEQDSGGELETLLYKADVLPTTTGGAQIVFSDIEMLKQKSPLLPTRKRNALDAVDSPAGCSVSVKAQGKKPCL